MESQNHSHTALRTIRKSRTACAALALLTISTLAACHTQPTAPAPTTAPSLSSAMLSTEEKQSCLEQGKYNGPSYLPVKGAVVCITIQFNTEGHDSTLVARFDAPDGDPQWAVSVSPQAADFTDHESDMYSAQQQAGNILQARTSGYATVSPNGQYVSLVLRPPEAKEDHPGRLLETPFNLAAQRTTVIVLDTASGRPVRTVEVSGLVLGQALTSDSLAVETADAYYPAGKGKGRISVFSLTEPSASPTSFPTSLWLAGSGKSSLLLSSQPPGGSGTSTSTVTQVDLHGKHLATFTDSSGIILGGWVRRNTYLPDEKRFHREVVDTNSGAVYDDDADRVWTHRVSTGPGLVIGQKSSDENGTITFTPQFWLSAADDGHPHTENLEQFSTK